MKKSKVLSIRISEVTKQIKKMKTKDLFTTYESFDNMITQIIQMFENNDYCRKHRLHQNFIYMIFLDLVKIYNVFYIMTMETLDRYKRMSSSEMNKALILYKNFCSFTETLRKEANTVPMLFGFSFKEPNYYKPDARKERAMKNALKDKESGGDGFADDGFGDDHFVEEMPEFEDQEKDDFGVDEYKEEDDEDSDDEYQFDLLGDIKKQEQMASVHAGGGYRGRRTVAAAPKREKIQVDDFNTAALDDLLGGGEAPPPQRSGTMNAVQNQDEEEWDPFPNKDNNVYGDSQSNAVPDTQKQGGASSNIFGDEDNEMWGGNQQVEQNQPASKQEQKQQLDDLLGGDDDYSGQNNDASMPVQDNGSDYNLLKNLYNTATAGPGAQNMGMGGQQPNYYNTSAGGGYNNDGGMGYNNNNYGGGMGYNGNQQQNYNTGYGQQPQNNYNTGYGGGYNDGGMGYNNYNQYNTGYAGGYGAQNNAGYGGGYGGAPQNTGFNTEAPGGNNQNNDYDPFS